MTENSNLPVPSKVAGFLAKVQKATPAVRPTGTAPAAGPARLVIGMDATASREPSWTAARATMDSMFREVPEGLAVQVTWYGGESFNKTRWATDARTLLDTVAGVRCQAGQTQIVRTLGHAVDEAARGGKVAAIVLIGDAFEEDEELAKAAARRLRLLGTPVFSFQEGMNSHATRVFEEVAAITGGARLPFDSQSPEKLRELLEGIAVFAQGGMRALEAATKRLPGAALLLSHMKGSEG